MRLPPHYKIKRCAKSLTQTVFEILLENKTINSLINQFTES